MLVVYEFHADSETAARTFVTQLGFRKQTDRRIMLRIDPVVLSGGFGGGIVIHPPAGATPPPENGGFYRVMALYSVRGEQPPSEALETLLLQNRLDERVEVAVQEIRLLSVS